MTSLMCNIIFCRGQVTSDPPQGDALTTSFSIVAKGWLTSNFPLFYIFSYQTNPSQPLLNVQSRSTISFTATTLPAGDPQQGNNINLITIVSDSYDCSVQVTSGVVVKINPDVDVGNVVADSLSNFGKKKL